MDKQTESRSQFEAEFRRRHSFVPEASMAMMLEQYNFGTDEDPDWGYYSLAARDAWEWWQAAQPNSPELPDGWIKCSERMPTPGVVVLVYSPPQPGDCPGDVRIGFDFIDPDGDDPAFWYEHGQNYEHFCCVAGGLEGCTGPSEKAPYTHWQPLPAPPTTEK